MTLDCILIIIAFKLMSEQVFETGVAAQGQSRFSWLQ